MRCYNGCPDSQLKAHLDAQADTRRKIEAMGYTVTWFPNGEFYQAFKDYRPVGSEHRTLDGVLSEIVSMGGENHVG